ncbi:unnamed protein product [Caretta caretta]
MTLGEKRESALTFKAKLNNAVLLGPTSQVCVTDSACIFTCTPPDCSSLSQGSCIFQLKNRRNIPDLPYPQCEEQDSRGAGIQHRLFSPIFQDSSLPTIHHANTSATASKRKTEGEAPTDAVRIKLETEIPHETVHLGCHQDSNPGFPITSTDFYHLK